MIQYPTKAKDLMKLAVDCMGEDDYAGAIRFAYEALSQEKEGYRKQGIYIFLAECYAMDGNEEYALQTLAQVMSRDEINVQAQVLMIATLLRMGVDTSIVGHYITSFMQLIRQYGVRSEQDLYLLCNSGGIRIDQSTVEAALNGRLLKKRHLKNADDRANELINRAKEYIFVHDYDMALETLQSIEQKGVSKSVRVEILNDECLCFMALGDVDMVHDRVQKVLDIDPCDVEALMVQYMLSVEDEQEDVAQQCIGRIGQADGLSDEKMSKVFTILSMDGKYRDIISIADKQLEYCPDCYVYNKCKAIALYNLGNRKACKKIFADMARLYPDMTGAEQYLYFLDKYASDNDGKVIDDCYLGQLYAEWQKLLDEVTADTAVDQYGRVNRKLALAIRYLVSKEFDGDMKAQSVKKLVELGVYAVEEFLSSLLIEEDVLPICKSEIIYRLSLAGRKRFAVMQDFKFNIVKLKSKRQLDKYSLTCQKAYCRACSYAACLGQKAIEKLGEALDEVWALARERRVSLRSADCLSAMLISYAFKRPIEALQPDVEYNTDTYLEYCHELFDN